jgi:hypothetical protein
MFSKDALHDILCYGTALVFIQIRIQSILPQYGSYYALAKPKQIYADLDPDAEQSLRQKYNYNFYISAFLSTGSRFYKITFWRSWVSGLIS